LIHQLEIMWFERAQTEVSMYSDRTPGVFYHKGCNTISQIVHGADCEFIGWG